MRYGKCRSLESRTVGNHQLLERNPRLRRMYVFRRDIDVPQHLVRGTALIGEHVEYRGQFGCLVHTLADADNQHVPYIVCTAARAGRDVNTFRLSQLNLPFPSRSGCRVALVGLRDRINAFSESPKRVSSGRFVRSSITGGRRRLSPCKEARSIKTSAADGGTLSGSDPVGGRFGPSQMPSVTQRFGRHRARTVAQQTAARRSPDQKS